MLQLDPLPEVACLISRTGVLILEHEVIVGRHVDVDMDPGSKLESAFSATFCIWKRNIQDFSKPTKYYRVALIGGPEMLSLKNRAPVEHIYIEPLDRLLRRFLQSQIHSCH
jgi:hypothetical protein